MTFQDLLNYTYAVKVALGLICMVDVVMRFKKFSSLMLSLFLLSFFFFIVGIGGLWEYHVEYNRFLLTLPVTLAAFSGVMFFALLLNPTTARWVFLFFISTFLFQVSQSFFYYHKYGYGLNVDLMKNDKTSEFLIWARIILLIIILFIPYMVIFRLRKKFNQHNFYYQRLRTWSVGVLVVFFIDLLSYFIRMDPAHMQLGLFIASLVHIFSLLLVLYRPGFINRMSGNISLLSLFSSPQLQQIERGKFNQAFFDDCFFLLPGADLEDFSRKTNWKPEHISSFVDQEYKQSFTHLIEQNRIEYFLALVQNGHARFMTIDAFAKTCGFSCQEELQRCFTQFHGGSAAEFILVHQEQ